MRRHFGQHARQGAYAQRVVCRDCHMVLSALSGSQAHMTPGLPSDLVPECMEGANELLAGDVARPSQTAMTSPRTKCRRMIRGRLDSSKGQITAPRT